MGFTTWSEAATAARDRAGWRRQVNGPILPEEIKETKKEKKSLSCYVLSIDRSDMFVARSVNKALTLTYKYFKHRLPCWLTRICK